MSRLPRLESRGAGFVWCTPQGEPTQLAALADLPDAEMDRWLPTHLEALDEVLIDVAGRLGSVLGGARRPDNAERQALSEAYVAIDRATVEYDDARLAVSAPDDLRAGQIIGTAALMSQLARTSLGLGGPVPFDGALDQPPVGVVAGHARLRWVEEDQPWRGARWLIETPDFRRLPAHLSMLLHDASGVDGTATKDEHREALRTVAASETPDAMVHSGSIDWLLHDWLMAHRDGEDSGAVQITSALASDARLIVESAAASVRLRRQFDPALP